MTDLTVTIPENITITLDRGQVTLILAVLKKLPYETAATLIEHIKAVCEAKEAAP